MRTFALLILTAQLVTGKSLVVGHMNFDDDNNWLLTFIFMRYTKMVMPDYDVMDNNNSFFAAEIINVPVAQLEINENIIKKPSDFAGLCNFIFNRKERKTYENFNNNNFLTDPAAFEEKLLLNIDTESRILINRVFFPIESFFFFFAMTHDMDHLHVKSVNHRIHLSDELWMTVLMEETFYQAKHTSPRQNFIAKQSSYQEKFIQLFSKKFVQERKIKLTYIGDKSEEAAVMADLGSKNKGPYLYLIYNHEFIVGVVPSDVLENEFTIEFFVNDFHDDAYTFNWVEGEVVFTPKIVCEVTKGFLSVSADESGYRLDLTCDGGVRNII